MKKWFLKYYLKKDVFKYFIITMLSCIIIGSITLIIPLLTRYIISNVIYTSNRALLYKYIILLFSIYIISYIAMRVMVYYGHKFGLNIEKNIRLDIYEKVLKNELDFFDKNKKGKIANTIINDTRRISETSHHVIENLVLIFIPFVVGFIILIQINIYLTCYVFMYLIISYFIVKSKRDNASKQYQEIYKNISIINEKNFEIIKNIELVKSYNQEQDEKENFFLRSKKYSKSYFKMSWEYTRFVAVFQYLISYLQIGLILISIYLKINNLVDYGTVVGFILYTSMITNSFSTLIDILQEVDKGIRSVEKVYDLYLVKNYIHSSEENDFITGNIDIKNMNVLRNEKVVLKNINLQIEKNSNIAFVGESGSGKTTLVKAIINLIEINSGEIVINNKNIKTIKTQQLLQNIGYMSQENFMINDSIYNNIKFSKNDATREEIVSAAKKANIHKFIKQLPNSYDTKISEYGSNLSGGQKQRISLARIFLKDPQIIILDEATSALDKKTEKEVTKIINQYSKTKTIITIAHNINTIVNCDYIYVLEQGEIIESGTHESLISKNGKYYNLATI